MASATSHIVARLLPFFVVASLLVACNAASPYVLTSLGRVNGLTCPGDTKVAQYLGIRYAQPPVGRLRWSRPLPIDRKYPANGINAKAYGPRCPQLEGGPSSEDCLFLNVWAPANASKSSKKLPVNVYIHGGGYQTGSGSDDTFNGCAQVADGNLVVVTLNYRLGILGYLALPGLEDVRTGLTAGNWGLRDQRLALRWVRDNIAAFGGDPQRVQLSGESAGAYSTLLHVVSPGSEGLFSSAFSFSGSTDVMAVDFLADAYAKGREVLRSLNCSSWPSRSRGFASTTHCLRAAPVAAILAVQAARAGATVRDLIPTIDGVFLPKHPLTLLKAGRVNKVSVVVGANANEGALEVVAQTQTATTINVERFFEVILHLLHVPPSFYPRVYQQYNAASWGDNWLVPAFLVVTHAGYMCPQRRVAEYLSRAGLPTRYYILQASKPNSGCSLQMTFGVPLPQEIVDFMDAFHGYDVPFTSLAPHREPYKSYCNFTPKERQLSSFMAGILAAHAATKSPVPARSASLTSPELKGVRWPTWNRTSQPILNIDTSGPSLLESPHILNGICKLWDDVLEFQVVRHTTSNNTLQGWP